MAADAGTVEPRAQQSSQQPAEEPAEEAAMEPTPPARRHHPVRVRPSVAAGGLSPSVAAVGLPGRDLRRLVAIAVGL